MRLRVQLWLACATLAAVCSSVRCAVAAPAVTPPEQARLVAEARRLDAMASQAQNGKGALTLPSALSPPAHSNEGTGLDRWLHDQLRTIEREKSRRTQANDLRELAGTLRRLAAPESPGQSPAQAPHVVAAAVLSGRAYRESGSGQAAAARESIWQIIGDFFGRLLARIFSGLFRAGTASPIVGQLLAIALVALLVGAMAYLIFRIVEALARRRGPSSPYEGSPLPERIDPDALYRRGADAASEGRYAQAIALLFQASLAWFDRQGTLAFDPSLTPTEYRRAVRRSLRSASPYFDTLAQAFIMAAFAERPASRSDWSAADSAYAQLRAAVSA